MNFIQDILAALDEAGSDFADLYVGEHAKELLAAGLGPLSVADALMTNALAIAAMQMGDDLEARKLLVQWHRLTRGSA